MPYIIFKMGYNIKGCAITYKILMNFNQNVISEVNNGWERVLNEAIGIQRFENSFRNLHNRKEGSFTKYIQFKMLHRRIVTNKKLYGMGIKENKCSSCPHCTEQIETIEHAFIYCNIAVNIWKEIENWLRVHVDGHISITDVDKICGIDQEENIVYKMIMATKKVIYRNRQVNTKYSINEIIAVLKLQLKCEEYKAVVENSFLEFLDVWEMMYNLI